MHNFDTVHEIALVAGPAPEADILFKEQDHHAGAAESWSRGFSRPLQQ